MDEVLLSRLQFAITSTYHFLFIPLTLGLSLFVAILETLYVKTNNERYKQMTKFWGKLFLVNFAMGVVTGIVQEFHFGMNWSEYSRFMGDIFGAPLALEALTAFFIESTFLGLWIFGWDRLSKKVHLICIWLVAFASNLSAYWILVANSFMQHPVGYTINNGRAEMVDFTALLTNPYVVGQFSHTVLSGIVTAGFFVISISAYHLLRKTHVESFTSTMKIGLVWTIIGLFAVMGSGHMQAQSLAKTQPMKLASLEALWETENPAPFSIYTSIDQDKQKNSSEIAIPRLLSFLVYNKPEGEIKGLKDLQIESVKQFGAGNYIPDVPSLFWSFRIMVLAGLLMIAVALVNALLIFKNKQAECPIALKCLLYALPLPYIANSTGWYVTEAGRQPWMVVGLQTVSAGVSQNITNTEVWISLIGFTLIYTVLAVVAVYVAIKFIKKGPETPLQSVKGGRA